ncbi:hypothetical protein GCM10020001_069230 [Nonomuraea salmonea]
MALHGLGDAALALVQAGVVERQPGTAGDVLDQQQVARGVRLRPLGPPEGQRADHLTDAADGGAMHADLMPVCASRSCWATAMPVSGGIR